jgi:hypothetical protein
MELILGLIIMFKWQDFISKLNTLFHFVDRVHEIWLAFDLPCDMHVYGLIRPMSRPTIIIIITHTKHNMKIT